MLSPLCGAVIGQDIFGQRQWLHEQASLYQRGDINDHLPDTRHQFQELFQEGSPILCRIHDEMNPNYGDLSLFGSDFLDGIGKMRTEIGLRA
jgi:hypothetical protein